jgi:4-amino-4-deoxy-L-arabinose transferase-like glycosyltransferase
VVRAEVLVVGAILAILAAHLPYLEAWPTVHNDEAREMSAFWVASGADPTARGLDPEFGADPLYKGGLQGLTVGAALRFWGLGLLQARLVSLAWGGVLLALVFLLGRRLYGTSGGLLAAFFLALARPFWLASHLVRPEIVLASLLALSCLLAYRAVAEQERWSGALAGLVLGLALDVHLNALAFGPLVGLVFLSTGAGFWRQRAFQAFLGGMLLGLVYVLAIRVLADPSQFATSSAYWIGVDKRPPLLDWDLGRMLSAEVGRFEGYFSSERRLELLALSGGLLFGLAASVVRRRPEPLAIGLLLAFALFVLVVSGKSEFYLVLFYPWLCLLLAGAVIWLARRTGPAWPLVVLAAFWLGPRVFGFEDNHDDLLTAAGNFPERGYYALMAEISPLVPLDASVLGPPLFWIGLHDRPYTDYYVWERLRAERGERFASFAARLKPDVLVLDAKSQHQISINSPGFLESNGVLLKTIRRVGFDRVEVWKLS